MLTLFAGCTDFFFYPQKELLLTPDVIGLDYTPVTIQSKEQPDLTGWYLPASTGPVRGTVVFLHGNAENVSTHIQSVHWLPAAGFNVLMAEYRGYGASDGVPDVAGVHDDAKRFLRYAVDTNTSRLPLILYGQSLGASIALRIASETDTPLALVIAESGFATYRSAARGSLRSLWIFRYLFYPFSVFVSDEYSPLDTLTQISAPVLFVHGDADQVVSIDQSKRMHEAIPDSTFWQIPDAGHLGIFTLPENRKRLERYLDRLAFVAARR